MRVAGLTGRCETACSVEGERVLVRDVASYLTASFFSDSRAFEIMSQAIHGAARRSKNGRDIPRWSKTDFLCP